MRPLAYYLLVALLLAVYIGLSVPSISLPGPQYDEALHAPAAIALIKGHMNLNPKPMWTISFAGRMLPVMHLEYLGSLKSYLLALSFFLFGVNIATLRLTTILVTAIGLLFFYWFAFEAFGRRVAMLATALLATDPSLILYSRNDWGPVSIALLLRSSALFCMCRWWQTGGKTVYLVASSMLMGLGIYDKTNFMWFVVAVLVAGSGAMVMTSKRPRVTTRGVVLSLIALVTTSAPLWVLNAFAHWPTLHAAVSLENRTTQTLAGRLDVLRNVLHGRATDLWMFGQSVSGVRTQAGTLLWPLFLAAMVFLLLIGLFGQRKRLHALVLLVLIIVTFVQICLTPLSIGPHHWIFLYPLPHLAIGFMFCYVTDSLNRLRWKKIFWLAPCAIILLATITFNMITVFNHQKLIRDTGGSNFWSDSIYSLAEALQTDYPNRPIQLMDWGFATQLSLLSGDALHLREPFWTYLKAPQAPEEFVRLAVNPANIFVVHGAATTKFPHIRALLSEAASRTDATTASERAFFDRHGNVIYKLIEFSTPASEMAAYYPHPVAGRNP